MTRPTLIAAALLAAAAPSSAAQRPTGDPLSAVQRLAPSAFADLPQTVRRDLEARGCRVPQSYDGPRTTLCGRWYRQLTAD
ncbi:MAG: hypothetical protein ABR499_20275 [Gemmatimonadaceae bacterium]